MKRLFLLLAHLVAGCSLDAGEFVNFGFNDANLSGLFTFPDGRALGEVANLLPGWTVKAEAPYEINTAWYDDSRVGGIGGFGVTLSKSRPDQVAAFGKFGLGVSNLQIVNGQEVSVEITVSQTGLVPPNAQTLRFYNRSSIAQPTVFINALEVEKRTFDPFHPVDYLEVDVRKHAGQEATIEFVFPGNRGATSTSFDVLGFSMIPEPDVRAFVVLGVLLMIGARVAKGVVIPDRKDSTEP